MKLFLPNTLAPARTLNVMFKFFACLLIFFIISGFSFVKAATDNYQVTSIDVEPLTDRIERTGVLAFRRTLNLSFQTNGFLKKLKVDEGDLFLNDQLLAALDLTELKAKKNATYAQLRQTKNDVERINALLAKKLSSEQQLEQMKTAVHTARAAYQIAYYNLEKAEIRSPFTGVVLKRYGELGELQSPERPVLQVAALEDNVVVKVALTGKEVSQIVLGQQVHVVFHNTGDITALVSKIAVVADSQSHLFTVEVLLPAIVFKNGAIAGQLAKVIFKVAANSLVYRIPIEALVSINTKGEALLMIKSSINKKVQQQAFHILKLDNQYLYIQATNNSSPLQVVTHGWQHLSLANNVNE